MYPPTSPGLHTAASYSTTNTGDIGGRGGAALAPSVSRVFMGGGGGAGSNNNGSNNNPSNAYGSSGGVGGGIVMMRIAYTSGSAATIYAQGTTGLAPDNDGGGGGGAGGSVVITSPNPFTGITVHADGAAGTTAAATSSDTAVTIQHGPGGGGGGGAVITSSPVTATVTGGPHGTTTTSGTTYGATSGANGIMQTVSAAQIPGVASGAECYSGGTAGNITTGPVGANSTTGSYDGVVPATNDNDFTARAFFPAGATLLNTGTTPGAWSGNTIAQGPTTVNVPNEFYANNPSTSSNETVTLTVTAPTSPAGWTARVCPDNGANAPSCAVAGSWLSVGTAGATSSSTFNVLKKTNSGNVKYWVVYSAPAGVVAFTRYDAVIAASDGTTTNYTHNELYPGFVVLTKTVTVQSTGCPAGVTPPASGVCPGGVLLYTIDYRNIVAGAASESGVAGAWPSTGAGSFVITENGASNANWSTTTNGLKEALVAGANGTTTFGDSTAGSTFSGATASSTAFTCTVGGASGSLVPSGVAGTSQGTLTFRVTVK
jgi:hypothetical protein